MPQPTRYSSTHITLHWLLAALILFLLVGGTIMHQLPPTTPNKPAMVALHKQLGLTVLLLVSIRLIVRFRIDQPQPYPQSPRLMAT